MSCEASRVYNGLPLDDIEAPTSRERAPFVLAVGRLVEKKGFEYAIRAVAQLRERKLDVLFDVLGDGPMRGRLENLVAEDAKKEEPAPKVEKPLISVPIGSPRQAPRIGADSAPQEHRSRALGSCGSEWRVRA